MIAPTNFIDFFPDFCDNFPKNREGASIMKKRTTIILALAALLAVLAALVTCLGYQKYESRFLVIDETKYSRTISSLDLSDTTIGEWEKLTELTGLQELNLLDTGITPQQYDTLAAALPGCAISWSVPMGENYVAWDIEELNLDTLTGDDLEMLSYLPQLTRLWVNSLESDRLIEEIQGRYPHLEFSYALEICGKSYPHTAKTLDLSNATMEELTAKLPYLPAVTTVNLTGKVPANEDMITLIRTFPQIKFLFDFEVFGVATNSAAEFLDLSYIQFSDTSEIDAIMPLFYNLSKVDMLYCGIENEDMGALNERYPDTLFVWMVKLHRKEFRTDITELIPVKHDVWITDVDCPNLCYFTELVALDLGHMHIHSCEFIAHMPKLKYLVLADSPLSDFSPLTGLQDLIFLELFLCPIEDYTPLTTLKNLQDLNICYTSADPAPLMEMTWLNTLWFSQPMYHPMNLEQEQALRNALPNTRIRLESGSSTGAGWRELQNYYDMRDCLGMGYLIG